MKMAKLAINGGSKAIVDDLDPVIHWPLVDDEIIAAVSDVLKAGSMSGSDITKQFEKAYAEWNGVEYGLGVCNGTAGLLEAFWACGIGAGDEVIAPSITYWASVAGILSLGAAVNFADIDPVNLCIDPADIEHRIGPGTKAIITVNYCGNMCDYDRISAIAKKHNLYVIEDNSHSHGALYKGRMAGSLGDISPASLMSGKAFAIGEAGIVLTHHRDLFERCVAFGHYERTGVASNFNTAAQYITDPALQVFSGLPIGGVNHRMNQTCAAMGLIQLKRYPEQMAEMTRAVNYIADRIDEIPGIHTYRPEPGSGTTMGGWYTPKAAYDASKMKGVPAGKFQQACIAEGLTIAWVNKPLHLHSFFHELDFFHQGKPTAVAFGQRDVRQGPGSLPVAESIHEKVIGLPNVKRLNRPLLDQIVNVYYKVAENLDELR